MSIKLMAQVWQTLGCLSWEDFCERYLHRPASRIDVVLGPALRAEQARPLNGNGQHATFDNYQSTDGGTSADYLTARIARDRPDILEDMKQGKYRSVRQAAIEAGIVKPQMRYSLPDDPQAAGRYLAQRVDREWFDALIDSYYKEIDG